MAKKKSATAGKKASPKKKPAPGCVYQFKITLLNTTPPIWRRIQVPDGTLDQLHEHIQTGQI